MILPPGLLVVPWTNRAFWRNAALSRGLVAPTRVVPSPLSSFWGDGALGSLLASLRSNKTLHTSLASSFGPIGFCKIQQGPLAFVRAINSLFVVGGLLEETIRPFGDQSFVNGQILPSCGLWSDKCHSCGSIRLCTLFFLASSAWQSNLVLQVDGLYPSSCLSGCGFPLQSDICPMDRHFSS